MLIAFGFTTYQFFRFLVRESAAGAATMHAARNFSVALVGIGILLLVLGIAGDIRFMLERTPSRGTGYRLAAGAGPKLLVPYPFGPVVRPAPRRLLRAVSS